MNGDASASEHGCGEKVKRECAHESVRLTWRVFFFVVLCVWCFPLHSASPFPPSPSDEFENRKREYESLKYRVGNRIPKLLCSAGKVYSSKYPFLQALADREEMVRNGKLTSILFIRDKNAKGQEVSGYIDYAHRMKQEDFTPYFNKKKKLIPRPADLSYYNWETQT